MSGPRQGSRAAALSAARRASSQYRTSPWPGKLHVTGHRGTPPPDPALTFLGGAADATGARYFVEAHGAKFVVGCGLFAGPDALWRRNFSPCPAELRSVDAVILPSADLGHAGFLPQLVAEGWHGPVFATPGTAALLPVALSDAAKQFGEDAAEGGGWAPGPAMPPFRAEDVTKAIDLVRPVEFGTLQRFAGAEFEFGSAGGRLGAAWVHVRAGGRSMVFAGPLGAADHLFLRPPDPRPRADVVVLAAPRPSGDRYLPGRLAAAVHRAIKRGGSVVVPVSAVGSTEVLLTMLHDLTEEGEISRIPVQADSLAGVEVHRRAVARAAPRRLRAGA